MTSTSIDTTSEIDSEIIKTRKRKASLQDPPLTPLYDNSMTKRLRISQTNEKPVLRSSRISTRSESQQQQNKSEKTKSLQLKVSNSQTSSNKSSLKKNTISTITTINNNTDNNNNKSNNNGTIKSSVNNSSPTSLTISLPIPPKKAGIKKKRSEELRSESSPTLSNPTATTPIEYDDQYFITFGHRIRKSESSTKRGTPSQTDKDMFEKAKMKSEVNKK